MSTDVKNLFEGGPDQETKTTEETRDITKGHKRFEISIDFFLYFRFLGMRGSATVLQVVLVPYV